MWALHLACFQRLVEAAFRAPHLGFQRCSLGPSEHLIRAFRGPRLAQVRIRRIPCRVFSLNSIAFPLGPEVEFFVGWAAGCVVTFRVDEAAEVKHAAWRGGSVPDGVVPRRCCCQVSGLHAMGGGGTRLRGLLGGGTGPFHPIRGGKDGLKSKKYSSRIPAACVEF